MNGTKNFMGKDGFYWWQGVVEDRMDPLFSGRCKVRILGAHTNDKGGKGIPTTEMYWAYPIIPVNQEERIVPPKEGTWVFGFFRDGDNCQDPVIVGCMPAVIEEGTPNLGIPPPAQKGFYDPVGIKSANDLLPTRPLNIEKGFILKPIDNSSTSERDVPHEEDLRPVNVYPKHVQEPDTHRLARDEGEFDPRKDQQLLWKIQNAIKKVRTSIVEYVWREPDPTTVYNALYPFNKVEESESGHVHEVDDTEYFERLHNFHRSGTYDEVQANGTKMHKTVGDSLFINHLDRKEYTINTERNTVGGSCFRLVMEDQNQICEGDNYYAIWSWPTIYVSCVNGDINIKVDGAGSVNIDATTINLNCGLSVDPPRPNRKPREGKFTNPIPPTAHPHGIPTGQSTAPAANNGTNSSSIPQGPLTTTPQANTNTSTATTGDTTTTTTGDTTTTTTGDTTTTTTGDTTTTTTTTGGGSTTRTLNPDGSTSVTRTAPDGTSTTTTIPDSTATTNGIPVASTAPAVTPISPAVIDTSTPTAPFTDPRTGAVIQPTDIITTSNGTYTAGQYQQMINNGTLPP